MPTKREGKGVKNVRKCAYVIYECPPKKMLDCGRRFLLLVRSFYNCSRQALGQNAECPPAKLRDFLNSSVDQVYEASEIGIDVVTKDIIESLKIITELNKSLQDGDWDTNKASEQIVAPVYLRSEIFKNEIKEAEMMKYKLENKVILLF